MQSAQRGRVCALRSQIGRVRGLPRWIGRNGLDVGTAARTIARARSPVNTVDRWSTKVGYCVRMSANTAPLSQTVQRGPMRRRSRAIGLHQPQAINGLARERSDHRRTNSQSDHNGEKSRIRDTYARVGIRPAPPPPTTGPIPPASWPNQHFSQLRSGRKPSAAASIDAKNRPRHTDQRFIGSIPLMQAQNCFAMALTK